MPLSSQKAFISRLSAIELTLLEDDHQSVEKLFSEYLGFSLFKNHKNNLSILKKNSTALLLKPAANCPKSYVSGVCFNINLKHLSHLNDLSNYCSAIEATVPFTGGFNCEGFNFYYTDSSNLQTQQLNDAGFQLVDKKSVKPVRSLSEAFQLVIDHLALYVSPSSARKLASVFENNLLFQKKASYVLTHPSALEVIPFEANCARLNLIIDQKASEISHIQDPYSHLALGTNQIFTLAEILRQAATDPFLQLEVLPLGGPLKPSTNGFTNFYYEETQRLYKSLQPADIELMKLYGIGYDENQSDPKSRGWQFFVQTPFGLLEGIKRLKNFQFTARLGEGITQGIYSCETNSAHKFYEVQLSA